jgi:hypothetical protein
MSEKDIKKERVLERMKESIYDAIMSYGATMDEVLAAIEEQLVWFRDLGRRIAPQAKPGPEDPEKVAERLNKEMQESGDNVTKLEATPKKTQDIIDEVFKGPVKFPPKIDDGLKEKAEEAMNAGCKTAMDVCKHIFPAVEMPACDSSMYKRIQNYVARFRIRAVDEPTIIERTVRRHKGEPTRLITVEKKLMEALNSDLHGVQEIKEFIFGHNVGRGTEQNAFSQVVKELMDKDVVEKQGMSIKTEYYLKGEGPAAEEPETVEEHIKKVAKNLPKGPVAEVAELCDECGKNPRAGLHAKLCMACRVGRQNKAKHTRWPHIYDENGEKRPDRREELNPFEAEEPEGEKFPSFKEVLEEKGAIPKAVEAPESPQKTETEETPPEEEKAQEKHDERDEGMSGETEPSYNINRATSTFKKAAKTGDQVVTQANLEKDGAVPDGNTSFLKKIQQNLEFQKEISESVGWIFDVRQDSGQVKLYIKRKWSAFNGGPE